ncbi:hypothetical protein SLS62_002456 [Diatrype stigma]|uniref:Uncharacterized protein n=1 Tax=Diatrype stigma TaxID=117547 RepID=A0AAN9YV65_9PEZI
MKLPWPTADFTDQAVIVTGANCGLGLEAARHFVRLNARKVILGCRGIAKGEAAKADIDTTENRPGAVEVWHLDLASFESVKAFCRRANELDRLDVVIENASLLSFTHELFEGYERQCTVNVISTWLMAILLLPALRRTKVEFYDKQGKPGMPHMCIVGSNGHFLTEFQQRNEPSIFEAFRGDFDMYHRYYNTKLLGVLFTRELAERLDASGKPQIVLNMVDPGYCWTELLREKPWPRPIMAVMYVADRILARSSEVGSRNYIWAASAGPESHGIYVEDCGLSTPAPLADSDEGKKLQKRAFVELLEILERISPGIIKNI